MEESVFVEKLALFGLGRQEAVIYFCLLRNEALTGYEISKMTGISRSNVYGTLGLLVEHGAAYVMEGTTNRYVGIPIEEFCDNRIRELSRTREELEKDRPDKKIMTDGYITIEGYQHICDKIYHMLKDTQMRVYFSGECKFLSKWEKELLYLVEAGRKVVLISENLPIVYEKQIADGSIIFYQVEPNTESENSKNQVRLIIDSECVLTGEVKESDRDTCLFSAQKNFVNVFKEAMRNEIELIKIRSGRNS